MPRSPLIADPAIPKVLSRPPPQTPVASLRIKPLGKLSIGRLSLSRPLAFFDLETTGLNVKTERIVEIAAVKILPEGYGFSASALVDPQRGIPTRASDVHRIRRLERPGQRALMVTGQGKTEKRQPAWTFREQAHLWHAFLRDCDLAGHNAACYDMSLLRHEMARAQIFDFPPPDIDVVDTLRLFRHADPGSKGVGKHRLKRAHEMYCGASMVDAHRAEADVMASLNVCLAMLEAHPDWPSTPAELVRLGREKTAAPVARPRGKLRAA